MPPRVPPFVSEVTVGRRTVLEWLGRSAVLALGADLIAVCSSPTTATSDAGADGSLAGGEYGGPGHDAGHDAPPAEVTCGPDAGAGPPFAPGTLDPPLPGWYVETVDPPDLQAVLQSWRLAVDGLCVAPQSFTFADLVCLSRQEQVTDFHCVEGWSVYDVPWSGVHLQRLFDLVQPTAAATHVTFHTLGDRYHESLPLGVALEPRTILGSAVGGSPLPLEHGFPLRVLVPRLLGYKNAKYVERTDAPVQGFWVKLGYSYDGEVRRPGCARASTRAGAYRRRGLVPGPVGGTGPPAERQPGPWRARGRRPAGHGLEGPPAGHRIPPVDQRRTRFGGWLRWLRRGCVSTWCVATNRYAKLRRGGEPGHAAPLQRVQVPSR
ncbi:MAG: molybdopterin-dependent oxidoreductase [Deltaproteobacteria bacterium]|nr:molybdopterin-dependent oxidoreductase [Deltaproteobacteria bacterium]